MRQYAIYILCLLLVTQLGCKKKPVAGLGGNAHLQLFAKHHGTVIDSITFYIKFNASDAPSINEYDFIQKGITISTGNTYASIEGLKEGNYYIYAQGWDPSISENVNGGIPYTIDEESHFEVVIPVTEMH